MNTFNKNAFSPNVDQNWKDKICIPNAVDCNQNFGIISFSEFSTWGGSSYNGTEQPRFSIKDDLTISTGSHTIKAGFTFDRQQANGFGQQDIGGRAGFSFLETGIPGATTLANGGGNSFASFLLGAADTGRTETIRYLQQVYPVLRLLRAGRLADERQAGAQLRSALRVHAARRAPAAISTPTFRRPSRIRPSTTILARLIFAGDGPGTRGHEQPLPRLLRCAGAAREFRVQR